MQTPALGCRNVPQAGRRSKPHRDCRALLHATAHRAKRHSKALKPWQSTGGKQVSSTNKSWGIGLLAVRCCSVPAISSFQQSPSSCRLVAWPGQLFLLTVIPRYAPETGSNSMGLEQPHLPKRRLIWGFCLYARLLLFYLRFSILAPVSYRESQSQARLWARSQSKDWAGAGGISLQMTSLGLLETLSMLQFKVWLFPQEWAL